VLEKREPLCYIGERAGDMSSKMERLDEERVSVEPRTLGLRELLEWQDLTLDKEVVFETLPLVGRSDE
jgi:hypothetical protein